MFKPYALEELDFFGFLVVISIYIVLKKLGSAGGESKPNASLAVSQTCAASRAIGFVAQGHTTFATIRR